MYEEIGKILADAAGNWRTVEEDCRDWRRELRRLQRDRDSSDPVVWARIQKLKRRLTCLEL
ncbi:MAG TPA: hypothetical protein VKK79_03915, partial [Candidatus Lokiarchaeia archaeon]|nr:hypothetical protein [Candidatus Lokiarchaeia archaeon]